MVTPESPLAGATGALSEDFAAADVTGLRHRVRRRAERAGLSGDILDDFVVAVHELVINAVVHGGGGGRLRLRLDDDTLICDVTDHGGGFPDGVPVSASPPAADVPGGRGILLARMLTDTLMFSDGPDGVTATVTVCVSAVPATDTPASLAGEEGVA